MLFVKKVGFIFSIVMGLSCMKVQAQQQYCAYKIDSDEIFNLVRLINFNFEDQWKLYEEGTISLLDLKENMKSAFKEVALELDRRYQGHDMSYYDKLVFLFGKESKRKNEEEMIANFNRDFAEKNQHKLELPIGSEWSKNQSYSDILMALCAAIESFCDTQKKQYVFACYVTVINLRASDESRVIFQVENYPLSLPWLSWLSPLSRAIDLCVIN